MAQNETGTHVQCHLCGYFFKNLGKHVVNEHKLTPKEYKSKFKLRLKRGLASEVTRVKAINAALACSSAEKVRRLEALKKGTAVTKGRLRQSHAKQSLEAKNEKGSCYYQLLDKIEVLGKELGRTPSLSDFRRKYKGHYIGAVYSTFGTWNQAVTFAGFTPRTYGGSQYKYNRDTVIAMIRNFWELEGRAPRVSDMGTLIPSSAVITKLFGGIIEARKAAGLGQYDYINEEAGQSQGNSNAPIRTTGSSRELVLKSALPKESIERNTVR